MSALPDLPKRNPRAPSWRVLTQLEQELRRQQESGQLLQVGLPDLMGRVEVNGVLDLAGIANAVNAALTGAFRQ